MHDEDTVFMQCYDCHGSDGRVEVRRRFLAAILGRHRQEHPDHRGIVGHASMPLEQSADHGWPQQSPMPGGPGDA